jgi:hypothetical protein
MDSDAAASVAAQFSDDSTKAAVSAAFANTIAATMSGKEASHYSSSTVDGVEPEDVTITSITASRRLMMKSRALQSGSLDVSYEVTAPSDVLDYNTALLVDVDTTEFATSLTTELQQVDGLSSVTVDSMAIPEAPTLQTEAPTPQPTFVVITTPAASVSTAAPDDHDHDYDHATVAPDTTATPKPAETTAEPTDVEDQSFTTDVEDQSFTTLAAFGLALAVLGA